MRLGGIGRIPAPRQRRFHGGVSRVPILIPVPIPPGFPARLDGTLQAGDSPSARPGLPHELSPSLPQRRARGELPGHGGCRTAPLQRTPAAAAGRGRAEAIIAAFLGHEPALLISLLH